MPTLQQTLHPRDRQRHDYPRRHGRRRSARLHTGRGGVRCEGSQHRRRLLTRERLLLVRRTCPGIPQVDTPHPRLLLTTRAGRRRQPHPPERRVRIRHAGDSSALKLHGGTVGGRAGGCAPGARLVPRAPRLTPTGLGGFPLQIPDPARRRSPSEVDSGHEVFDALTRIHGPNGLESSSEGNLPPRNDLGLKRDLRTLDRPEPQPIRTCDHPPTPPTLPRGISPPAVDPDGQLSTAPRRTN